MGRVDMLARHAEALGLSIVDVLRSALDQSKSKISPEAARIVRKFQATTVEGREALMALARALPDEKPV